MAGQWESFGAYTIIFEENGTGKLLALGNSRDFTWKYDKELSCYTLATSYGNFSAFLKDDGENEYLDCFGTELYRPEIFSAKCKSHLDTVRQELEKEVEGKQKIELGKEYTTPEISVKFSLSAEDGQLWIYADITNNGATAIDTIGSENCPMGVGFKRSYYDYGDWTFSHGLDLNWSFVGDTTSIEAGKSGVVKAVVCKDLRGSLKKYGVILGYMTCNVGEVQDGYIDLGDYTE